jgi:hypothetical protein
VSGDRITAKPAVHFFEGGFSGGGFYIDEKVRNTR